MTHDRPRTTRRAAAFRPALPILSTLVAAAGCSSEAPPLASEAGTNAQMSFDEFMSMIYREPDTGTYIVDGDTPILSERELERFYLEFVQQGALIVHQQNGADAKWNNNQKLNLTYCVSTTFGANYNAVVSAMNAAAGAWEAVANVNFVYQAAQDANCTAGNNNVVFDVRPVSSGAYLARAFFPNYARANRNVLIDSSAFGNIGVWTLAGILRHELGHALGFRHEHTRPQSGTCFEDNNWRQLTSYDSASVMHYPHCNGTQVGDLVITPKDAEGAALLYGAAGPAPICAHSKCTSGAALNAGACGGSVQSVCNADPYCCSTAWDSVCVSEVYSIGSSVACATGACSHSLCSEGAALTAGCDSHGITTLICNEDPYCCQTLWDRVCIDELSSVAGKNCD